MQQLGNVSGVGPACILNLYLKYAFITKGISLCDHWQLVLNYHLCNMYTQYCATLNTLNLQNLTEVLGGRMPSVPCNTVKARAQPLLRMGASPHPNTVITIKRCTKANNKFKAIRNKQKQTARTKTLLKVIQ